MILQIQVRSITSSNLPSQTLELLPHFVEIHIALPIMLRVFLNMIAVFNSSGLARGTAGGDGVPDFISG